MSGEYRWPGLCPICGCVLDDPDHEAFCEQKMYVEDVQAELVAAIAAVRAAESALNDATDAAWAADRAKSDAANELRWAKGKLHRLLYLP